MKKIEQTYSIKAPLAAVWQAFVDPIVIEKWSGSKAEMSAVEGADFSLWDGDIHGTNTKIVERQVLVQDWFSSGWEKASVATFTFRARGGETIVNLVHDNVPDEDAFEIAKGWHDYYLGQIKRFLEAASSQH